MSDWVIERGHIIPEANYKPGQVSDLRNAFAGMDIGESLFSETIDRMRMSNAYMKVAYGGKKFVSRAVKGGARVWRVA